jgi:hypothetical protein
VRAPTKYELVVNLKSAKALGGGIIRIVMPQVAVAIGSTIYGGRASTIAVALIIGALGAFLSFKGYVRRA